MGTKVFDSVCFYDKKICKHVALTIHLNLIVKGISEYRTLIEKFTIRTKPGIKQKSTAGCALTNDSIQGPQPKSNYKTKENNRK